MLYAIGRNINKYHRFLQHELEKFEGKRGAENSIEKDAVSQTGRKGFCAPK